MINNLFISKSGEKNGCMNNRLTVFYMCPEAKRSEIAVLVE
jgi:hypothetical protein